MICYKIFNHFAKPNSLICSQIDDEKWVGMFLRSAEAYKHCLNIKNAFSEYSNDFSLGKASRFIVSGNRARVNEIMCHTKLVTPVSNRDHFLNFK